MTISRCLMLSVATAAFVVTPAAGDKPELEAIGNAIRVEPIRAALISPDLKLQSAWVELGGIAQDECWGNLVFDCFEPVHRPTWISPDKYAPTDGAAWGGWDPVCDIGEQGVGGTSYRWWIWQAYCNNYFVNDMQFDPPASGRYGMMELAWYWYATGCPSSEQCYIFLWIDDDFYDCTTGPPASNNNLSGVVWDLGCLTACGAYYYYVADACELGGAELPTDGDGAYRIAFAKAITPDFEFASCAVPMLWAAKPGPDWDGEANPSSQGAPYWADNAPNDGAFTGDECYQYDFGCRPDPLGPMWCCWAYDDGDPWCGDDWIDCGDANCDGTVNGFDIDAFIVGLGDPWFWEWVQWPHTAICVLDTNGDENVDGFDIDGFVQVVSGGVCPRYE